MKQEIFEQSVQMKLFFEQSTKFIKDDTITDTDLCKFKVDGDRRHAHLKQIENKTLRKKIHLDFHPCTIDFENMLLGRVELRELENQVKSLVGVTADSNQVSSASSLSSSTSSLPILTPPQSPKTSANSRKKTNLDLVKESGIWAGNDSKFWCPSGITTHPQTNEIILADSWNHRIQIRNPENTRVTHTLASATGNSSQSPGEFNNPKDVCIDANNKRLIVSDSGNNRVQVFSLDNYEFRLTFGRYGFGKAEFRNQIGVCVDDKSQIYVCDRGNHRVQVLDSNGTWLKDFGARGDSNGQFECPEYLCISPVNYLLVSDSCNNRIQIFDLCGLDVNANRFGAFIGSFGSYGSEPGLFHSPRGITTDSDGFIMVADCKNNRLQLFEPNGEFIRVINETCSDEFGRNIAFDRPVAICATSNGGLLITEWGRSHRVQIF